MVAISPFARLIREHRRENPLSYPIAARLGGDDAREGGRGHSCPATPTQSEELGTTRPLSHTPERARRAYAKTLVFSVYNGPCPPPPPPAPLVPRLLDH